MNNGPSVYIPTATFLPVLEELIADAGSQSALARQIEGSGTMSLHAAARKIYSILHGEYPTVSVAVADRIITGAGRTDLWHLSGLSDAVVERDEEFKREAQRRSWREGYHRRKVTVA